MRLRSTWLIVIVALALVAGACGGSDDDDDASPGGGGDGTQPPAQEIDYEAIGLWDDGPCDESKAPLVVGTSTVFESPVISLGDLAIALEAAAVAFNARGGANGSCIEVHTCDDGANPDHVPFGDSRYAIELPRATLAKGADVGPDVAAAVARLRGLVAAGRGPAPETTSIEMRSRAAFDEARERWLENEGRAR